MVTASLTEGHAGELFFETALLLRIADICQAVRQLKEAFLGQIASACQARRRPFGANPHSPNPLSPGLPPIRRERKG